MPSLRPADLESFRAIGVDESVLHDAAVRRVTHTEAREICGIRDSSNHLEGLSFPYTKPNDDSVLTYRVRRDRPEVDSNGKLLAKYVNTSGRHHLYYLPGCRPALADTAAPAILVEAEKSVLAI